MLPRSAVYLYSGSLPAIFIMESMMDHVAKDLGMDADTFRKMNLYKQGQVCGYSRVLNTFTETNGAGT